MTGLFFGSFDPPHIGHFIVMDEALTQCDIDNIVIIPSFKHANKTHVASYADRCNMLRTMIDKFPINISLIEQDLICDDYIKTYDVLQLYEQYYPNEQFAIITTAETYNQIPNWYEGFKILSDYKFYIATAHTKDDRCFKIPQINTHSSDLRKLDLPNVYSANIPYPVYKYIKQNNLYNKLKNFPIIHNGKEYWISRSMAVTCCIMLKKDNAIYVLLVQRGKGSPDNVGKWCMPCGYIDYGETITEAVIREVYEETGLDINGEQITLFNIIDSPSSYLQNVSFHHRVWINENKLKNLKITNIEKDEISNFQLVDVKDIDTIDMAFDHAEIIKNLFDVSNS